MQGIDYHARTAALFGATLLFTALTACTSEASSSPGGPKRVSYELVTEERPEDMAVYRKRLRLEYELCVTQAELRGLPVKPFPAIPADALRSRTIYVSDGRSFATSQEEWGMDNTDAVPEKGCVTRHSSAISKTVIRDGFQYIVGASAPGEETAPPMPAPLLPFDAEKASAYTVPQTKKGIALKCVDAKSPLIASGFVSDACIVDPAVANISSADGEPIQVNLRNLSGEAIHGGVSVFEAVSLKTGIKVDPAHFSIEGKK